MERGKRKALDRQQRIAWLRLWRSENVGPITFRRLLERYGEAERALAALPDLARRGGRRKPLKVASRAKALAELEAIEALEAGLLCLGEPGYPAALAATDDAPPALSYLGFTHLLERPALAVVGARNASANGQRLAERLAADLAAAGLLVVSGLARGIDAAAHRGALEKGTAAVVAGGIDVVYPKENEALQHEIAARGLILAEMPPGTEPQGRHFPRRNRIIAGLALGTLVVEAAPRSGSLITARLALEQGREVFAVPGSPLDPRARGCNGLIRQGAVLVETADDVLQALEGQLRAPVAEPESARFRPAPPSPPPEDEVAAARAEVLTLLSPTPVGLDELLRLADCPPALVHMVLLELELAGRLERHPGGRVALAAEI
jgi:DNA processing protein